MMIGIDAHKSTHTAVAVDDVGRVIAELTVRARDQGHQRLLGWARRVAGEDRLWAIEDCRHVSGRLERMLLAHGEQVVRVPPKLVGRFRREQRSYGKSDSIDATAVARAALREPDLSVAYLDDECLEVRRLVDRREDLVGERTREINRLLWHLHDLDPDLEAKGKLTYPSGIHRVADRLDELDGTIQVEVCRDLLDRIDQLNHRIVDYHARIKELVKKHWPQLLEIDGCAELTAAKLVGEIGNIDRFASDHKLAMHAGVAPLPVSSGEQTRHRLNRRGNRQLNAAIHRIAINQCKREGPGRTYRDRKIAAGKTKREAIRSLKRHLVRTVYQTLKTPQPPQLDIGASQGARGSRGGEFWGGRVVGVWAGFAPHRWGWGVGSAGWSVGGPSPHAASVVGSGGSLPAAVGASVVVVPGDGPVDELSAQVFAVGETVAGPAQQRLLSDRGAGTVDPTPVEMCGLATLWRGAAQGAAAVTREDPAPDGRWDDSGGAADVDDLPVGVLDDAGDDTVVDDRCQLGDRQGATEGGFGNAACGCHGWLSAASGFRADQPGMDMHHPGVVLGH